MAQPFPVPLKRHDNSEGLPPKYDKVLAPTKTNI